MSEPAQPSHVPPLESFPIGSDTGNERAEHQHSGLDRLLVRGTSLWQDAWRRLRKNRMAVGSLYVLLGLMVICFALPPLLPWLAGPLYSPEVQRLEYGCRPPSPAHWFGTDFLGRDLLVRTIYGTRMSLLVGLVAAVVAATVGTVYGAFSGYVGGRTDALMMRFVDVLYTLPYMFIVILLVTILDKQLWLIFVALGLVGWLTTARIVRGQVLSLKEREFVLAARSIGQSHTWIVLKHLIPNTLGPIIVYFTLTVPAMILQEAFLSFLGLGVQEPASSLGSLISEGAGQIAVFWWPLIFPASVLCLLLLALSFIGDGLRDALDPHMKS
jgi:oligopeptide transport system permease protein